MNEYLITHASLSPTSLSSPVGLVISSSFSYAAPLTYPSPLLAALSVASLGRSSVTYSVALFDAVDAGTGKGRGELVQGGWEGRVVSSAVKVREGGERAACWGSFTHVFVDPKTRKSVGIPKESREALEKLLV